MINKSIKLLLLLPLFSCSLVGCNKKDSLYSNLKSVAPYMHMVTYKDYEVDTNHESMGLPSYSDFGCSAVKNTHLFGRNFDYYYTDMPSFLVKVKANNKHFASMGIAFHGALKEVDVLKLEKEHNNHSHDLEIIPNRTIDGINEKGVACCVNVCDFLDLGEQYRTGITGTNPDGEDLFAPFVCRYVLDHATSAKNAIDLLKNCNIHITNQESKNNLHYMIADANETYIVELIDNQMVAVAKVEDDQIMTNYYLNMTTEQIEATGTPTTLPNHAHGTERYDSLKIDYKDCNSINGMLEALYKVRFSAMYPESPTIPDEPFNPSEDYTQTQIVGKDYPGRKNTYITTRDVLNNKRRDIGKEKDVWITFHTSIYDFNDKKLYLINQEDYERSYEVDFDTFLVKEVEININ